VSHDPSRKRFLARMLGFAAVGALAPRAVAEAAAGPRTNKADGNAVAFRLRPQARAVARRGGAA
jgi:hypothetical protein